MWLISITRGRRLFYELTEEGRGDYVKTIEEEAEKPA